MRTAEGVVLDGGGRTPGRGAYLCRDPACWRAAEKKRSLERALDVHLGPDDWARLASGILTLPSIIP